MRRFWNRMRWLSPVLCLTAGCYTLGSGFQPFWKKEPRVKAPPHVEEYNLPPTDDSRFNGSPVEYPKGTLNNDLLKKKDSNLPGMPPAPGTTHFGSTGGI